MSMNSSHISFETMTEIVLQTIPKSEHLSNCAECAAEFSRLEKLIGVMLKDDSAAAPPYLLARMQSRFEEHFAEKQADAPEKSSVLQKILAVLISDSAAMTPAFGVRSSPDASRQLLYLMGNNDLDLRISPEGEKWSVAGQIFGTIENGKAALTGENAAEETALNELGEFVFAPVAAGKYALRFEIGAEEFEISEINVGL